MSAPAEDRTPSDAMCTICGNPRHYPALAEQCVGWHSIGLADVVDWPLEGEDAPAEDRTRSPLSRKLDSSAKWYAEYDESGRRAERFREYAEDARQLEAENARLTAALDRVPDDTDRLDWLEREVVRLEVVRLEFTEAGSEAGDYGSVLSSWPRSFWINDGDGRDHSTLREAIDAARTQPEGSNG